MKKGTHTTLTLSRTIIDHLLTQICLNGPCTHERMSKNSSVYKKVTPIQTSKLAANNWMLDPEPKSLNAFIAGYENCQVSLETSPTSRNFDSYDGSI